MRRVIWAAGVVVACGLVVVCDGGKVASTLDSVGSAAADAVDAVADYFGGSDALAAGDNGAPMGATPYMGGEPACPAGTVARGNAPPEGHHLWCEMPTGTRHGFEVTWCANGQRSYEWTLWRDLQDGVTTAWYCNGNKQYQWTTTKGVQHGRQRFWTDDGSLSSCACFNDGKQVWSTNDQAECDSKPCP